MAPLMSSSEHSNIKLNLTKNCLHALSSNFRSVSTVTCRPSRMPRLLEEILSLEEISLTGRYFWSRPLFLHILFFQEISLTGRYFQSDFCLPGPTAAPWCSWWCKWTWKFRSIFIHRQFQEVAGSLGAKITPSHALFSNNPKMESESVGPTLKVKV